eukprot:1924742-Amphidinium_carterae.1
MAVATSAMKKQHSQFEFGLLAGVNYGCAQLPKPLKRTLTNMREYTCIVPKHIAGYQSKV